MWVGQISLPENLDPMDLGGLKCSCRELEVTGCIIRDLPDDAFSRSVFVRKPARELHLEKHCNREMGRNGIASIRSEL